MTKKLEVVSNFDPAGTQPEAIKSLVSGIDNGLLHQVGISLPIKLWEESQNWKPVLMMVYSV